MGLVLSVVTVSVGLLTAIYLAGVKGVAKHQPGQDRFFVPAPKFYTHIELLNAFVNGVESLFGVKLLPLEPAKYIELSKTETPKGAEAYFGPQDEFIKGTKLASLDLERAPTSPVGRMILRFMIPRLIAARKNVMQYIIDNPAIAKIKLESPVIVLGLPRTGSTLMYHLLAEDPNTRAPHFWEMYHSSDPMPPAKKSEFATHPRRAAVKKRLLALDDLAPGMIAEMSKSHVMDAEQIDEELVFLMQQMVLANFMTMCGFNDYCKWIFEADNKKFLYIYMLRFIQALHEANPPNKHWTLKSPIHALYIETLLQVFPDARVVIMHRDLANVVPSICKYFESMSTYFLQDKRLDRREFGKIIVEMAVNQTERMKAFRKGNPSIAKQFYDVKYEDFMKDKVGTVKGIYKHFKMDYSEQFEKNLNSYISNNPQGKHGRAAYDAGDYGLDKDQLREMFTDYTKTYL